MQLPPASEPSCQTWINWSFCNRKASSRLKRSSDLPFIFSSAAPAWVQPDPLRNMLGESGQGIADKKCSAFETLLQQVATRTAMILGCRPPRSPSARCGSSTASTRSESGPRQRSSSKGFCHTATTWASLAKTLTLRPRGCLGYLVIDILFSRLRIITIFFFCRNNTAGLRSFLGCDSFGYLLGSWPK